MTEISPEDEFGLLAEMAEDLTHEAYAGEYSCLPAVVNKHGNGSR